MSQDDQINEVPSTLGYSPAIRRVYWTISAVIGLALVLSLLVADMTRQREVQKSDQFEDAVSSQASVESRRAIAERVDRFAALAKSLASSSEFRNPSDHDKDGARYMDRDREQGGQMALYDHITTWLQSESGPPVPLLDWRKLPKSVAVWQLARGLPIRSPGGALLAKGRRRLVADTLSSNPEIASIAELDSRGRVVFLAPYAVQLTLETFNLRPTVGPLQSGAEARALFLRVPSGGGVPAALSIVVPFERATGIYYLLLTLGPRVPTVRELPGGSPSFGVFDGQGEILMYAGDPAALLAASAGRAPAGGERASHSSVLIGGLDYSLVTLTPNSPVRAAIEVGFLATIATYILAFALMLLIVRRVLLWLTREQWKRNHLRAQTERAAQDLAHDFRKGLLMLRTTKDSISHKLDSLDLQRLEGAIIDITGYADHLSRSLVADTFALPEVPGGAVSAQVEATAYVRGISERDRTACCDVEAVHSVGCIRRSSGRRAVRGDRCYRPYSNRLEPARQFDRRVPRGWHRRGLGGDSGKWAGH